MCIQPRFKSVWASAQSDQSLVFHQKNVRPFQIMYRIKNMHIYVINKVRKASTIRNRYNQVPHLTQDTTGESDKNTIKHHKQEPRGQSFHKQEPRGQPFHKQEPRGQPFHKQVPRDQPYKIYFIKY